MLKILVSLLFALAVTQAPAQDLPPHPYVKMETTEGDIILELDSRQAPLTVAHFLGLVDSGFYDGTIFHRVIPEFMIQGGGHTPDLTLKESEESIHNESGNGLTNARGTIAMARTGDPHSANSQFFINVADNRRLDPKKQQTGGTWGYTVFGLVIEGMDVVDRIVSTRTGPQGQFRSDVPIVPIIIESVTRHSFE